VINLNVVTVLNAVTGRYNEIHTLMMPRITQHFTMKVGYYEYREAFRCGFLQTQDYILLWTPDVDL